MELSEVAILWWPFLMRSRVHLPAFHCSTTASTPSHLRLCFAGTALLSSESVASVCGSGERGCGRPRYERLHPKQEGRYVPDRVT